ncbi:hypothetical protein I4U23_029739 [Adineta vaga]|nr:hypothetical protein I4U23_029739 [Adineta vaga]
MTDLRAAIIIAVFSALIISVGGEKDHRLHARHAHGHGHEHPRPCTNNPAQNPYDPPCNPSTSKTTTESDIHDSSEEQSQSSSTTNTMTTSEPTVLEHAHWCRFSNGTYISLGFTYMNSICSMCQCTTSRAIRCQQLQCLPTYCIDNTMPYRKDGQCCAQCGYEVARNSCVYNGVTFPHGVVMKSVENKMQCWCQLGNIECRNYIGSLLDSLDMLSDDRVIYTIVMILAVVLIFGFLVCIGCTFFFYYYYKRYEHTFQQAYDQYMNSAGWQPMNEEEATEGEFVDNEKQIEAEQTYHGSAFGQDMVPPPYAVHNDSYGYKEKDQQI